MKKRNYLWFLLLLPALAFHYLAIAQDDRTVDEANGLEVGAKAPLFEAMDQDSSTFVLAEALKKGPVVLLFYRGQWCPVCNRHLSNLQDSLGYIQAKGATVIAVSPEKPPLLKKTEDKTNAGFTLLYDEDYRISNAYDVTFKPMEKRRTMYNKRLKANLKEAHSDDSERLPVPATYIIGKDTTIVWRHFDRNYKNRATVKDITDNL